MREPLWRQQGEEPDYRFSLANERTFLAWIRTALGLLAGGVVLDQFSLKLGPHSVVMALALAFGVLAAVLCALAYVRWRANEIAMRHSRRLPPTAAMAMIAVSTAVIASLMVVLWLVKLW